MMYLANELYRSATNASLGVDGKARMLLSFEVEPAATSTMTIISAVLPGETHPRQLRAKRMPDGTLDITFRSAEEIDEAGAAAKAAAGGRCGLAPGALAHVPWAWPFPMVQMSDWVTYENLLRGLIGSVPLRKALKEGVAMKLKRSSVKGVSLIRFEMQLKGSSEVGLLQPPEEVFNPDLAQGELTPLEVWEAVVQVKDSKDKAEGVEFVPLSVKRKHAYHSTLTLSPAGWANFVGMGNKTTPLGTERYDPGYQP
jgi:hypothetical protein